ncbi:NAD(+) synthase, partial [Mycobacterium tuberculosis]|nr:NAD(+) synthase [Mycobacterium tuberculosis]
MAAYAYSAAGPGESTTDLAWDGHAAVFEYGALLAAAERFPTGSVMAVADIDVGRLRQERIRLGTFGDCIRAAGDPASPFRTVEFRFQPPAA